MLSTPSTPSNPQSGNTQSGTILWVISTLAVFVGGAMLDVTIEKYAEWIPDLLVILFWLLVACLWFYWGVIRYRHLIYTHTRMSCVITIIVGAIIGGGFAGLVWWKVYRQPPPTTSAPTISNAELKQEVLKFVGELRNFNDRMAAAYPQSFERERNEALKATKSQKKQQEILKRYSDMELESIRRWMEQRQREYDNNYFAKTEAFKDALFNRIPPEKLQNWKPHFFRNLAGNRPIIQIAADLERLANLLD
jgi:hypothetical protein